MNAQHTPGPWAVRASCNDIFVEWVDRDNTVNPKVCRVAGTVNSGEGMANARLIAAIPDLLEALHAQIRAHKMLCDAAGLDDQAHLDGTAQVRAAIAKATGGAA